MGEEHRFVGEEASRGNGVHFIVVKCILIPLFFPF